MLDLSTVFLMSMLVHVVLTMTMFIYWRTQKTYRGFGYWALSNLFLAMTFFIFASKGFIPGFFSTGLANISVILALVIRNEAVRQFWGTEKFKKYNIIVLILVALPVWYFTVIDNVLVNRTVLVSTCLAYYGVSIAYGMAKGMRTTSKVTPYMIIFLHLTYALFIEARAIQWLMDPSVQNLFLSNVMNNLFFLTAFLLDIGIAVSFLMLNGQRLAEELCKTQKTLERLATTDSLTGIYTRRKLVELIENEILRSRRLKHSFSVLMFDIDYFKMINDTYGHAAGDRVLTSVVQIVTEQIRDIDIVGRLGGDEFVVALPETGIEEAYIVAERLRKAIEDHSIEWENGNISVQVSIGVIEWSEQDFNFIDLLKRVDRNLYKAKENGRNNVSYLLREMKDARPFLE